MRRYLLILFLLLNSELLLCQVRASQARKADELYESKNYAEAVRYFLWLLQYSPSDPVLNFKTGNCYLHSRSQRSKALPYLEMAVKEEHLSLLPSNACELLGDSYLLNNRFTEANAAYAKCREQLMNDSVIYAHLGWKMGMCEQCTLSKPDKASFIRQLSGQDELQLLFSRGDL